MQKNSIENNRKMLQRYKMLKGTTYIFKQLKAIAQNKDIVLDKNTRRNIMEDLTDWYKKEMISEDMFKSIKFVLENYNNLYCNN
ncbi:hypothetical protein [Crassaminicella profunda]|uniref:hypothetical protein n=1 Tax=Crassaminicella profunda TaxID=1286698 RepID=UPI001CA7B267|nr:hypothetical protein [Crassaminicella profunda]QZY53778.1 hypothetical protein K7H06_11985 [Crassaminicella profunda]